VNKHTGGFADRKYQGAQSTSRQKSSISSQLIFHKLQECW